MNSNLPHAPELTAYHEQAIGDPATTAPHSGALGDAIVRNHRYNCLLWAEEDLARRRDVPDADIAANKRAIDGYNQKRNDATEAVDEILLALFARVERQAGCRLNSETAGSMIDRLSILSLKVFHMRAQTERTDADSEHIARCRDKLALLCEQRGDLQSCFDALLADCQSGVAYYKIYRQFKMYNDPSLNPHLYASAAAPEVESKIR